MKEQNGRESLRRLKPIVGCNVIKNEVQNMKHVKKKRKRQGRCIQLNTSPALL
jgi:hypothetical protein